MSLVLQDVTIRLLGSPLVDKFSVTIAPGETVTLMGASGSGKSSLLAYLAGDPPEPLHGEGQVSLNGIDMLGLAPERRQIGRLFQDDLLFPHLVVMENLLFGMPRGERGAREALALDALERAGIGDLATRMPHTLSGGQRSRVALLRALLAEPLAILLDEPFAKLDIPLRQSIRDYVYSSLAAKGVPALLVTHDPADVPAGGRVFRIDGSGTVTNV